MFHLSTIDFRCLPCPSYFLSPNARLQHFVHHCILCMNLFFFIVTEILRAVHIYGVHNKNCAIVHHFEQFIPKLSPRLVFDETVFRVFNLTTEGCSIWISWSRIFTPYIGSNLSSWRYYRLCKFCRFCRYFKHCRNCIWCKYCIFCRYCIQCKYFILSRYYK